MRMYWISWTVVWFVFSADEEARCEIPRGHFTNPIKLGPNVNSGAGVAAPNESADGLTLYFNSNRGGGWGSYDIYQATRATVNDAFGDVMNLGPDLNSPANDGKSIISFDGLTLYFRSNRSRGVGSADIWQATRATMNDTFGDVINLGAINSAFDDRPGHISRDDLTLYFHSNRRGGAGGFDIYMATRENLSDPFGDVTNLAGGINASTGESSPSVSSDGLVMFFSDRPRAPVRRGGDGGADLWVAERESTDQPFGDVVNVDNFSLNSDVNSRFSEWNPSISRDWPALGSRLYFQSNRPGIYQATWVPEPMLQAGDANQNLSFDQLDLVQVQVAAKYLTEEAATWGEGDWDGAPGGSPGNPPAGDGLFNQFDIIAANVAGLYLQGPYAAVKTGGATGDGLTSLVYDVGTGELSVDAPAGMELSSINVTSTGGSFLGGKPAVLNGAFDNFASDNIFKATFGGSFGSISFGNILPAGIAEIALAADLSAVGSLAGGGDLGNVDLVYVPEPASALMLVLGLVMGLSYLRKLKR